MTVENAFLAAAAAILLGFALAAISNVYVTAIVLIVVATGLAMYLMTRDRGGVA